MNRRDFLKTIVISGAAIGMKHSGADGMIRMFESEYYKKSGFLPRYYPEIDKFGFTDINGNAFIEPVFYDVGDFSEGLAGFKVDGKWGFVDEKGGVVIKPRFLSVHPFNSGLSKVYINKKFGFIDRKGKVVINPIFDDASDFLKGLAAIEIDGKHGAIDKEGDIVIETPFSFVGHFSDGLAKVFKSGKWGYIDEKWNLAIPLQYDAVPDDFSEGLAGVMLNGRLCFIDKKGKVAIRTPSQVAQVSRFSEGMAAVQSSGFKWGFINRHGDIVIEPKFDKAFDFSRGMARVVYQGFSFFINKNEEILQSDRDLFSYHADAVPIRGFSSPISSWRTIVDIVGRDFFELERHVSFTRFKKGTSVVGKFII